MNLQKFFEYDRKSEYTLTVSIRGWQPSLSKLLLQCIFEWDTLDVITLHIQMHNVNVLKLLSLTPLGDGVNRLGLNEIGRTSYKWHWAKERSRQARLHFVFVVPKTLKFPYWCNLVVVWSNHYAIECKLHIENIFLINYTKQEDYLRNSPQGGSRECRVLQPDSIRNNYICRIH